MVVKVYYFDIKAIAEPIRIILSYGGEDFEDVRVPFTNFPSGSNPLPPDVKAKGNWGQVPVVEFDDGRILAQSLAITRYFAKKHNLVPKDDFQAALCDEYVDACREYCLLWGKFVRETDEAKRMELFNEAYATAKTRFLSVFNSIIEKNDGKHLVGNSLTWADIYLAHVVINVDMVKQRLDEFPALKSLAENVCAEPKIKAWMDKQPKTLPY